MTSQPRCWCGHHERYHGGDSCTLCDKQRLHESHPFRLANPPEKVVMLERIGRYELKERVGAGGAGNRIFGGRYPP